MEKFSKLLESHESFSCYNVILKDRRERKKKKRFGNQQPSFEMFGEGSETIMGISF